MIYDLAARVLVNGFPLKKKIKNTCKTRLSGVYYSACISHNMYTKRF